MPTKETLQNRRILHASQIVDGLSELLCIVCNTNKPREEFVTPRGFRQKCYDCAEKEKIAYNKYKKEHCDSILDKSKNYEEIRKQKRKETIEEHKRMVEEGCETVICTKCKEHKPIGSFRGSTRQITKHCLECRSYSMLVESRRPPDTRYRQPRFRERTTGHTLSMKYGLYKRNDIAKGLCLDGEFSNILPRKFAYTLMKCECSYCGYIPPDGINGLDRVDSKKPHSYDNVLSCCETCNISKNDMTFRQFVEYTQRLSPVFKYIMTPTKRSFECPF
jgi:hypothetical protein